MSEENLKNAENRMPHSYEAERAVIGCLLQESENIEEVFATISHEMFYDDRLRAIFLSIGQLRKESMEVDRITARNLAIPKLGGMIEEKVRNIKSKAKELEGYAEESLTEEFFVDLLKDAAFSANVMSYCNVIKEKYIMRKAIEISNNVIEGCRKGSASATAICNDAQEEFYKLTNDSANKDYVQAVDLAKPILQEIEDAGKTKDGITGVKTGYRGLDVLTAGLQKSDMIVLAGRPGMGKTTFALNLAYNICAKNKQNVLFFSLEMNAMQLVKRIVSSTSFVSSSLIRSGKLSQDDMNAVFYSLFDLKDKKLFIIDNSYLTIAELRNKCMKVKQSEGLDIVFIDYLQLMHAGSNYRNSGNSKNGFMSRQEEVAEISRNIKAIAKDLNVPIVALSQLHREAENRSGPPQLSDLRESGAIEQDADVVMIIHRPNKEEKQNVQVIIAKHRNGSTGHIDLRFDEATTRFSEWDAKKETE